MQSLCPAKITKGMIFVGCSFTWGQGLYYYSNLPTLSEPLPDHFDRNLLTTSHIRFMESTRFARQVASHFNTWELVHPHNSGSNREDINWWCQQFADQEIDHCEISHLVFQLTHWHRNTFEFSLDGNEYKLAFWEIGEEPYRSIFTTWLSRNNISLESWIDSYIRTNLSEVKGFLTEMESKGIKTAIVAWPNEYIKYINNDAWMSDRLVWLTHADKKYPTIETIMDAHKEMMIKYDYNNFAVPPQDHHPSMLCHTVIANSLIKFLEIR